MGIYSIGALHMTADSRVLSCLLNDGGIAGAIKKFFCLFNDGLNITL